MIISPLIFISKGCPTIYGGRNMLVITRRSQIKEILLARKSITVSELSKIFSVTEETIRRDLQQLENSGFLTRTYGGAFIQDGALSEVDFVLNETFLHLCILILSPLIFPLIIHSVYYTGSGLPLLTKTFRNII